MKESTILPIKLVMMGLFLMLTMTPITMMIMTLICLEWIVEYIRTMMYQRMLDMILEWYPLIIVWIKEYIMELTMMMIMVPTVIIIM